MNIWRSNQTFSITRRGLVLSLAFTCFSTGASADIITVDDDAPADFSDVQPAIDAAMEGDIILIRPGDYGRAQIVGKSVSLVGVGSTQVTLLGATAIYIRDLNAMQRVHLSGLTAIAGGEESPIDGGNCQGVIVVSDVHSCCSGYHTEHGNYFWSCKKLFLSRLTYQTDGYHSGIPGGGGFGIALGTSCAITNSFATGDEGALGINSGADKYSGYAGGVGAGVHESRLLCARTTFKGGPGGDCDWHPLNCACYPLSGGDGGPALAVTGSTSEVFIADDGKHLLLGANGGDGLENPCVPGCWNYGGDGGAGIFIDSGTKTPLRVVVSNTNVYGGLGGDSGTQPGQDGEQYKGDQSRFEFPVDPIPTFEVTGTFIAGGTGELNVFGLPGDFAFLLVSDAFDFEEIANTGYFPLIAVPGSFWIFFPAGTIPAGGKLSTPFTIPNLAGLEGFTASLQAFVVPPFGDTRSPQLTNFDTFTIHEDW